MLASPGVLASGLQKTTQKPSGDDHRVSLSCASHTDSGPPSEEGYCPAPQQPACRADTPVTQACTWLMMDERRVHDSRWRERCSLSLSPGRVVLMLEGSATTSSLGFRRPGQASRQELDLQPGVAGDSRKTSGAPSWRARRTQGSPNNAYARGSAPGAWAARCSQKHKSE